MYRDSGEKGSRNDRNYQRHRDEGNYDKRRQYSEYEDRNYKRNPYKNDNRTTKYSKPSQSFAPNKGEYSLSVKPGPYKARVNVFPLTIDTNWLKNTTFYLHDVRFLYEGSEDKMTNEEIRLHFFGKWKSKKLNSFFVYDGQSIMISDKKYSYEELILAKQSITITFTSELDLLYESETQSSLYKQFMQLILNQETSNIGWNQLLKSKFFYNSSTYWHNINIEPYKLWYGMQQHFIQYKNAQSAVQLGVYRDMTGVVGIRAMTLKNLIKELIHQKCNVTTNLDFENENSGNEFLEKHLRFLNSEFKGLSIAVEAKHRPESRLFKIREICSFVADSNEAEFENKEGNKYTVYSYFLEAYPTWGIKRQEILINVGRSNKPILLPVDVCHVPAQKLRNLSESTKEELMRRLALSPSQRINYINSCNSDIPLRTSGPLKLTVSNTMKEVDAEILPYPNLVYNRKVDTQGKASWNLRETKLLRPRSGRVAFIHMSNDSKQYTREFLDAMSKHNIRLENQGSEVIIGSRSNPIDARGIKDYLEKISRKSIDLVVIFIPFKFPFGVKEDLKAITDPFCASQCICMESVRKSSRNMAMYWSNVALKVNLKLGGTNNKIDENDGSGSIFSRIVGNDSSTLILGADVTYFNNKAIGPSICSIVGSIDDSFTVHANICIPQAPKKEIIENFDDAIDHILKSRRKYGIVNPPSKVIYMRDGVSTSQLEDIAINEIPKLKSALSSHSKNPPKLVCLVAVKRHGKRFFAKDHDQSPPPGFTVLNDLKEAQPWESFYLQAHTGRIGTLSSTHYFILENDLELTKYKVAAFTNSLCYLWARCTSAISIPAPIKAADIAASRYRGSIRSSLTKSHRIDLQNYNNEDSKDPSTICRAAATVCEPWLNYKPMYWT